jgi:uncharacterized protein YwgA
VSKKSGFVISNPFPLNMYSPVVGSISTQVPRLCNVKSIEVDGGVAKPA